MVQFSKEKVWRRLNTSSTENIILNRFIEMSQSDKEDFRVRIYQLIYRSLKKTLTFKIQKIVRKIKECNKTKEEIESRGGDETKLERITHELERGTKQKAKADSISKENLRLLALYMMKEIYEIPLDKKTEFFEKELVDFLQKIEDFMNGQADNFENIKWFQESTKDLKPMKELDERVKLILHKVHVKKEKNKALRKKREEKKKLRKQMRELQKENAEAQGQENGIEEEKDDNNEENGAMDEEEGEDIVIDYGSDEETPKPIEEKKKVEKKNQSKKDFQNNKNQKGNNKNNNQQGNNKGKSKERNNSQNRGKTGDRNGPKDRQGRNKDGTNDKRSFNKFNKSEDNKGDRKGRSFSKGGDSNDRSQDKVEKKFKKDSGNNDRKPSKDNKGGNKDRGNSRENAKDRPKNEKPAENKKDKRLPLEELHPSWRARIEEKKNVFIAPFQGQKVKLA